MTNPLGEITSSPPLESWEKEPREERTSNPMLSIEALVSRGRAVAANHGVSYPSSARAEQIRTLIGELVDRIERMQAALLDIRDKQLMTLTIARSRATYALGAADETTGEQT